MHCEGGLAQCRLDGVEHLGALHGYPTCSRTEQQRYECIQENCYADMRQDHGNLYECIIGSFRQGSQEGFEMGKRLSFESLDQVKQYAQARFPMSKPFSQMDAAQKAYGNIYNWTLLDPDLDQFKRELQDHISNVRLNATRERIYQFFVDRIAVSVVKPEEVER